MKVVGLTGSIGMGKSTTAALFRTAGDPVYDADAAVHRLYAVGGAAVEPVGDAFPGVVVCGAVDRARLGERVVSDAEAMARLEAIVHPLVRLEQDAFLAAAREARARLAILDIPLLFETGRDRAVDAVVVVSAPADVQHARVLARSGMTEERLAAILAKQAPDAEKRARAHCVIDTSRGVDDAARQVEAVRRAFLGLG
ncbi:dephospho-CoA kinase [Acuticoccus sp.]|uniref:dephospho-CoA kinase n=1 Tax=Acuticoccus sp. TaxID=1904378 RepID=UPI003B51DDB2